MLHPFGKNLYSAIQLSTDLIIHDNKYLDHCFTSIDRIKKENIVHIFSVYEQHTTSLKYTVVIIFCILARTV